MKFHFKSMLVAPVALLATLVSMQACSDDDPVDGDDPDASSSSSSSSGNGGSSSGNGGSSSSGQPITDSGSDARSNADASADGSTDAAVAFTWSKDYCAVLDAKFLPPDECGFHWSEVFAEVYNGELTRHCETGNFGTGVADAADYLEGLRIWSAQLFGCEVDNVPPAPSSLPFAPAETGVANKKFSQLDLDRLTASVLEAVAYELENAELGCTAEDATDFTAAEKTEINARLDDLAALYHDPALTTHQYSICDL